MENDNKILWKPGMDLKNANGSVSDQALGYQYTIQTTTFIRAEVIKQKFYEIPVADFVPVVVGTGAFLEDIKTNLQFDLMGDFESGIQGTASGPTQVAQVEVGTSPKTAKVKTWAYGYQYNTIEVEKALASNNWNVIEGKMGALKKRWDLGIQKIAFLGMHSDAAVPGLLSNSDITVNTAIITSKISELSADNFQTFVATVLGAYFTNSGSTVLPDTFVMPMADYLGMTAAASSTFPMISKLEYLLKAFREATMNPNFKIKGLAYCDKANNAGFWAALGTNRYVLYRNDAETLKMDIPVPFILNPAATADNFNWNGVSLGQFTGTIIYRNPEVLYFDWA